MSSYIEFWNLLLDTPLVLMLIPALISSVFILMGFMIIFERWMRD